MSFPQELDPYKKSVANIVLAIESSWSDCHMLDPQTRLPLASPNYYEYLSEQLVRAAISNPTLFLRALPKLLCFVEQSPSFRIASCSNETLARDKTL